MLLRAEERVLLIDHSKFAKPISRSSVRLARFIESSATGRRGGIADALHRANVAIDADPTAAILVVGDGC